MTENIPRGGAAAGSVFDGLPAAIVELELPRSVEGPGVPHLRYRVHGGGRS
jgi:hypothetical protein